MIRRFNIEVYRGRLRLIKPKRGRPLWYRVKGRRLALVISLAIVCWYAPSVVISKPLIANPENSSRAILDREGGLVQLPLTGDEKYRVWTPLEEVAPEVIEATLSYEDRWFWYHPGVNPVAVLRAAIGNGGRWIGAIFSGRKGIRSVGASTITMQLARKRFRLSTRSFGGKVRQILEAMRIEYFYSKREILEAYLNTVPYGANIEGIGAAARVYYRVPPARLTAHQAKFLTLIPQNPTHRGPVSQENKERLLAAWQHEFGGTIESAIAPDTVLGGRSELPRSAPHFARRATSLSHHYGEIQTTLSPVMQRTAERALERFLRHNRTLGMTNGTVMIIDSRTMEVLAYVGSANYTDRTIQGFVNGLIARRSPGSALKPFIYALAIDQGLITPDTLLKDTPRRFATYHPENFERNFLGPLSATAALVRSRNIPAIDLTKSLRSPSLYNFFGKAGFSLSESESHYGLALALGAFEVSMEEMLAAYAMLAEGGGVYRPLAWFGPSGEQGTQLLSAESAYLVREMLRKNPRPQQLFGAHSFGSESSIPWKTGTSFGAKDAWAIGIVDALVVGVWIGNFDGKPNTNFVGRDAAGPLLFSLIDGLKGEIEIPRSRAAMPRNLALIDLCALSGAPANAHCPHTQKGWIVAGVSSIRPCSVHRQVMIDPRTGLRVCRESDVSDVRRDVYEVWESDILSLFQQSGLARRTPPPFQGLCTTPDSSDLTPHPPRILSPQEGVTYQLRPDAESTIELTATTDGGHSRLYWFVDDELVGEGATVMWRGRVGTFRVRVVDDQGRAATRAVRVVWAPG